MSAVGLFSRLNERKDDFLVGFRCEDGAVYESGGEDTGGERVEAMEGMCFSWGPNVKWVSENESGRTSSQRAKLGTCSSGARGGQSR